MREEKFQLSTAEFIMSKIKVAAVGPPHQYRRKVRKALFSECGSQLTEGKFGYTEEEDHPVAGPTAIIGKFHSKFATEPIEKLRASLTEACSAQKAANRAAARLRQ